MSDPIQELKIRAEILQNRIEAHDSQALKRLRVLPAYRRASEDDLLRVAESIRRQDCLSVLAAELGFDNWPQAKQALEGEVAGEDFGKLLCPERCGGHINRWYKTYSEAAADRESSGDYLLGFRRQFLVVDRHYIESLGLDPDDAAWSEIGYDWVRPKSLSARTRLYAKLLARMPAEAVR